MKIIVTGGRSYPDISKVERVLDYVNPSEVAIGDCPTGVDLFVKSYCEYHDIYFTVYEADWYNFGKAAGPIRNKRMVETNKSFDMLIAFPGGNGTKDCVQHSKDNNLLILKVE